MKSIEEYILEAKNMKNISDGGSAAYDFGSVVLIKYSIPTKYGVARENEELVAVSANEMKANGVNTPRHLAIKRIYEGDNNICFVLQEKANGISFTNYCTSDPKLQLYYQEELAGAPDSHYEKCISDLSMLFHMGLELKPKNIFYDKSKDNGGFTFIDLLNYDSTPMDFDSIRDVLWLDKYARFISNFTQISSYNNMASEEEKNRSLELSYQIRCKIFKAMEKVIPNFNKFRRWILRTNPKDLLSFFENNGIFVGDLSLTEVEYAQFDYYIEEIVNECIEKISSGENKLWQIEVNEIRNMLNEMGMREAYSIHISNPINNREEYEDEWEFEQAQRENLDALVKDKFYQRLIEIANVSTNPNILEAKKELNEKMATENKKRR